MSAWPDVAAASLLGIQLILDEHLADGEIYLISMPPKRLILGTGPVDNVTWCRWEALRIVRTGLADVLEWLGEPPWRPPATSAQFLAALREAR